MRIALTVAMIMAAGIAWADEPPAAEAQAEAAAAETAPAPAAEPATATEATTAEGASNESSATEASATQESTAAAETDDKPFKVPPGYRTKTIDGKKMYCKSVVTSGSRFGKEQCRTEEQLRTIERQKAPPPLSNPSCSGTCASR